ncbi:hypothetical protein FNV43_RR20825 [Rhamnella rubrinervis]|uniref:F-ATPase gamma subunit n=1 Tax=Rhamnella rubrinervis TaxID=2594499 RepID=A0A8K0GTS1_9ROSA|nr:hypothetical protein FNV43_RR20825 [Rhamnella rubrinervis]
MAMAALRREGRRSLAPLISPHPINAARSSLVPAEDQALYGVRSISTQVVRNRMKSVKNIQKITKAMKMVAASKLRAIQTRAENSRGLWQPFTALLGDTPSVDVKKNVIVTVSSDKGLCGGINSTSVKISRALHKLNSGPDKESKYVILGEKAKAQMIRDSKKDIELSITELQKNPLNYTQVSVLADDILKNVEFDALRIIFNKFQSVVSFIPTVATVLSPEVVERESESGGKVGDLDAYEIEGGETKSEILQNLAEYQFSCVLFNAVLENACSEQGARMSAMDSSSRNAGEMLDRLTLTYNRPMDIVSPPICYAIVQVRSYGQLGCIDATPGNHGSCWTIRLRSIKKGLNTKMIPGIERDTRERERERETASGGVGLRLLSLMR